MPLTVPSGALTKANWITPYLKPLLDAVETIANDAQTAATNAMSTAQAKYTKPAQGIPVTDLAAGATNTNWITPSNGTWPVRPTSSTNVTYVWVRRTLTDPAVPIGGTGAIVGHDFVLQPDA